MQSLNSVRVTLRTNQLAIHAFAVASLLAVFASPDVNADSLESSVY
jgi:hypothetical protein